VVKTGHGREGGGGEVGGVLLADERVGVGRVADDNRLGVTGAVVVDGLADVDEDSAVVLEQVTTLHAGAARLGTDEEVVVDILEGGGEVAGDDDFVEEREGAIVQLSLDASQDLLLEGEVEQVKNDTLVLAEELARSDSEDDGVSDLASGAGDEDALGLVALTSGSSGHGAASNHVDTVELVEGSRKHVDYF
jgi:hypothetical protein